MQHSTVEIALEYEVKTPTHFCFNVEAALCEGQEILSERLAVSSGVAPRSFTDEGSGNRFIRFDALPGPLMLNYQADVQVNYVAGGVQLAQMPVSQVPDAIFRYLLPTRYCESDLLSGQAQQLFGQTEPGMARVRAVARWVHESIDYRPGTTTSTTTAREVFMQRTGVCRDFAHLGITFCRALNIPARLVVGYVWFDEPPQDFHAIFEVWLGGRWVLIDPSYMAPVERLVRIGTGRDAKDVAFSTIFGTVQMTRKEVRVDEHDAALAVHEQVQAQQAAEDA